MNLDYYLLWFKDKWINQKFPLFTKKQIKKMIREQSKRP
jgi:hypothetical protein